VTVLIVTLLIDTSVVKINDLIDKYFIPLQSKLILFSINSSLCLLLEFLIIKYIQSSSESYKLNKRLMIWAFNRISLISLFVLASLIGILIFQQFHNHYFYTPVSIMIIVISYGTAATLILFLSIMFFSWFKSNRNLIVFLYFMSMLMIAFNLIVTAAFTSVKMNDLPDRIGEYVGSSGDVTLAKHLFLANVSRIFSFISFFSIWITTAILMNNYREKSTNAIVYWILLSVTLVYFLITYFYQYTLSKILISYLAIDPVTVSIMLGTFLALSKPIGGLLFGLAFWKISRIISYERTIRTYMIISGFGIFLVFAANQAATQVVSPYPPFGLSSITVLNIGAFLMLLGIYNSATLVSTNHTLRKLIRKHALESRLLDLIGQAEMDTEIRRTVKKITQKKDTLEMDKEAKFELDEKELEKYIYSVIRETKKEKNTKDQW
jgi:hypothetical protein